MAALTPKQEAFCQRYIETSNASEAYRLAYNSKAKPATQHRSAHEVLAHPKVAARLAELRAKLETAHDVTVASLLTELEEARKVGKDRGQASAMVAATLGKARLAGLDKGAGEDDPETTPTRIEVTVKDGRLSADP